MSGCLNVSIVRVGEPMSVSIGLVCSSRDYPSSFNDDFNDDFR